MKIYHHGTKHQQSRGIRYFVNNDNISLRWNASQQVLELVALDNLHPHRTGGDYNTRPFHCVVQITPDEFKMIRDAARSAGLMDDITQLETAYQKLRDVAAKTGKSLLRAAKLPEKRPKPKAAKK